MAERPVELSTGQCLERLASHSVGRVIFCADDGPQVYLVNYAVDDGTIVFRTSAYGTLASLIHHSQVAFEVDELDREHHHGWSVIAHGRASALEGDEAHEQTTLRMLEPWAEGSRALHIRITPRELTGRQFTGDS